MLELPESYHLARQAKKLLTGREIKQVQVLQTPHKFAFFGKTPELIPSMLEGQTFEETTYHGGILEFQTADYMIYFSDGASLRFYEKKEDFPKKHQLAILFEDGTGLFMSVRMYAVLNVCEKGTCTDGYYISSSTKLNPMDEGFSFEHFMSLVPPDSKLTLKGLLATEQRIPGLGNGVLQDILWDAGFDPRFHVRDLSDSDFHTIYDSVCRILRKMCEDGGRDTESDLLGRSGGYIGQLSKKTLQEPCMKCGGPLEKAAYMGGTIYFCSHCQKR